MSRPVSRALEIELSDADGQIDNAVSDIVDPILARGRDDGGPVLLRGDIQLSLGLQPDVLDASLDCRAHRTDRDEPLC